MMGVHVKKKKERKELGYKKAIFSIKKKWLGGGSLGASFVQDFWANGTMCSTEQVAPIRGSYARFTFEHSTVINAISNTWKTQMQNYKELCKPCKDITTEAGNINALRNK